MAPIRVMRTRSSVPSLAEARNLALRSTDSGFVLFMEADWTLDPASLTLLQSATEADSNRAIAVPLFLDEDGAEQKGHNIRRFPTPAALCVEYLVLHKLLGSFMGTDPWTRHYRMTDFDHRQDADVDHACGAVALVRRDMLLQVGGYDEHFIPAWMEDVELGQRLKAAGYTTRFCHRALARHLGRETTRHRLIEAHYVDFYRGVLRYCRSHLGVSWQLVRLCLLMGLIAKAGFSYLLPGSIRRLLLEHHRIYNSDQEIRSYRHMYLRAARMAVRGA